MAVTDTDKRAPSRAEGESLLDGISTPMDLRALKLEVLPLVCDEVREFLLDTVQRTGGHLGSNLGVVELTTALHYVFDFRRDRLVWDVSHQCYPHKILTGRRDGFARLRQTGGMCGFTHPDESEYDLFHTGHAGTSVSLGLGMALGLAGEEDPPHVVSVIGDAALGAGVAFEALNHAGAVGGKLLVVLNDNEWSISRSVGAMARYLSRLRSTRILQRAGQEITNLIQAIPVIGPRVDRTLDQAGEVLRHTFVPGHIFEELGVTYVGPIDGHDVLAVVKQLERVRHLDGVVILHLLTDKGRGHPDAPDHPERVHGVGPAPVPSQEGRASAVAPAPKGPTFTAAFGKSMVAAGERDLRVRAITAAMPTGTGLADFGDRFPGRFFDTGITEQHAVALSAGLARVGLRPVVAIYSTFLQRGYDQVFQEVALQGLPVLMALDRAGLVGQDGATHHGLFDIAYLRALPGIVLCAPRDATDLDRMMRMALALDGPVAMRYPRDRSPAEEVLPEGERTPMEPGRAEVLREGGDAVVWAYGPLVGMALTAAANLARRGVKIGVVDARFARPLDQELLGRHLSEYRHLITLEEHMRCGGFGAAVLEEASRMPGRGARIRILGVPDRFIPHMSSREEQLAACGLDAAGVERTVLSALQTTRVR
jgi:1-deoxy-D-xylulose-5-phosphate synthase